MTTTANKSGGVTESYEERQQNKTNAVIILKILHQDTSFFSNVEVNNIGRDCLFYEQYFLAVVATGANFSTVKYDILQYYIASIIRFYELNLY